MNRLKIFLVGAALTMGGSALASAQALSQNVAYHDRDHDRRSDHDRDRKFVTRRWDGHRWQYWDGFRWAY